MLSKIEEKIKQIFQTKQKAVLYGATLLLTLKLINRIYKSLQLSKKRKLYTKVLSKLRNERKEKINQFINKYSSVVNNQLQQKILTLSATQLIEQIRSSQITSKQIVITFSLRLCQIGMEKNYIADVNFESALEQANIKDNDIQNYKTNNITLPPLHGLPIAIKDHFPVQGFYCTNGLISRAQKKQESDCALIEVLRNQGAIFICMTTLPQFSMDYVCETEIWGKGLNPYNDEFSCGGSSGGSAGVVSTRCMPLAIGTDLAGSIRLPASWCGVYGFKPTNTRVSKRGTLGVAVDGDMNSDRDISVSVGPIGRNSEDLVLFCREVFGKIFTDPLKNVMPWNEQSYQQFGNQKLNFGIVGKCDIIPFTQQNSNVIEEVSQRLQQEGHNVIQFDFDQFWQIQILAGSLLIGSNLALQLKQGLQGEKPSTWCQKQIQYGNMPFFIKQIFSYLFRKAEDNWMSSMFTYNTLNYSEACQQQRKFDQEVYKFFDYWREKKIDILILPNSQYFTCKHFADMVAIAPSYWFITCQLKLPVGTIPIRLSKENEEIYKTNKQSPIISEIRKHLINSRNLPVSIQVAALPFEDEKCLKAMKMIENLFKFYQLPM